LCLFPELKMLLAKLNTSVFNWLSVPVEEEGGVSGDVHLLEQGLFFRSINFGKFDGGVLLLQDLGGLDKF